VSEGVKTWLWTGRQVGRWMDYLIERLLQTTSKHANRQAIYNR
jgi:hypothetical protein